MTVRVLWLAVSVLAALGGLVWFCAEMGGPHAVAAFLLCVAGMCSAGACLGRAAYAAGYRARRHHHHHRHW